MEIEITQRHINQGTPGTGRDCAIARAMKEQLSLVMGRVPDVYVDKSKVISEFVARFDTNKALVSPVTITISPYFPNAARIERDYSYAQMMPMAQIMDEDKTPDYTVTAPYPKSHFEEMYNKYHYGTEMVPKFKPYPYGTY